MEIDVEMALEAKLMEYVRVAEVEPAFRTVLAGAKFTTSQDWEDFSGWIG